jgi:23S rRNA (cytidine1920-2'-O)/16S rRNA (cytidine1409-2'-O)-methyltransferase
VKRDKVRLDSLLVDRGIAKTLQQAIGIIMSGNISVDGVVADKAGKLVAEDAEIQTKSPMPYVSRGGLKLEEALRVFGINAAEKIAIDIGASTGGFTDCLLQHGAKKVYAVDVGYGQLHWRLRQDPRVVNLERTHILRLDWGLIQDPIDIAVADLSFISLTRILPALWEHLPPPVVIIALIKPQFEVSKNEVGRGGVVRDMTKIEKAVNKITEFAERRVGFKVRGVIPSPISGQKGNLEYLLCLER